jgi:hypothetical protein
MLDAIDLEMKERVHEGVDGRERSGEEVDFKDRS